MSTFLLTDSHSHSTTLSQKIRLNLLPASLLSVPFCFPSPLHYFRVNVTSCCSHLCSQNDTNFIKYCQQFLILGRHEYEGQGQISLVCLSSLSKICLPVLLQFSIAVTVFLLFLPLPLYPQDLFIHLKSSMIERERYPVHFQMAATAVAGPGQSQKLENHVCLPHGQQGSKFLSHHWYCFLDIFAGS